METIEAIFESYKASCNEETPHNEEQDTAMCELEKATLIHPENGQSAFDKAVALSRASEKAGFILGFKMAFNLMSECRGGVAISGAVAGGLNACCLTTHYRKAVQTMARLGAGTRKRADGTLEKRFTIDGKRYSVYGKTAKEIE